MLEVDPKQWAEFMKDAENHPAVLSYWLSYGLRGMLETAYSDKYGRRDPAFSDWVRTETRKLLKQEKKKSRS